MKLSSTKRAINIYPLPEEAVVLGSAHSTQILTEEEIRRSKSSPEIENLTEKGHAATLRKNRLKTLCEVFRRYKQD